MNKTFIEKKIKERAESRYNKELLDLARFIEQSPVGRKICIGENRLATSDGFRYYYADGIITEKIKSERIAELEQEEIDNILIKLENLQYLFNND